MELGLTQKQIQTLSPQMIQALEILQMGSLELSAYLERLVEENPVLEQDAPPQQPDDDRTQLLRRKLEWLESTDVQNYWYHREDTQEDCDPLARSGCDPMEESLTYFLRSQVRFDQLPAPVARVTEALMERLDSNGWLDEPVRDLAVQLAVPKQTVKEALDILQGLDPAGVGARDLSECLCLQLKRRGERGLALTIAEHYLDAMSRDRYNLIAKQTGASRGEIAAACALIRSLNPRPATGFSARENLRYLNPDLIVVKFEDRFQLITNDSYLPSLRLSEYYSRLFHETDDPQVKEYLNGKLTQADQVVRSVAQRRSTLSSCARFLVDRQEAFFRYGPGHLRPLTLADAARELGLHESTVSRAVRDKYLQCTYGVYPLGYFFTRSVGGSDGEAATADRAHALLRALIDGEDKQKPLSDQTLVQLLAEQGLTLSRRTVAKYRSELGIPSTAGRRAF